MIFTEDIGIFPITQLPIFANLCFPRYSALLRAMFLSHACTRDTAPKEAVSLAVHSPFARVKIVFAVQLTHRNRFWIQHVRDHGREWFTAWL